MSACLDIGELMAGLCQLCIILKQLNITLADIHRYFTISGCYLHTVLDVVKTAKRLRMFFSVLCSRLLLISLPYWGGFVFGSYALRGLAFSSDPSQLDQTHVELLSSLVIN